MRTSQTRLLGSADAPPNDLSRNKAKEAQAGAGEGLPTMADALTEGMDCRDLAFCHRPFRLTSRY
jgi:hypothetical protein